MNAFLDLAEKQITGPRKARMRATAKRALNKELRDRNRQHQVWLRFHKKERDALLAGPHGEAARELVAFLETMTLEQAPELIELVARGPWRSADSDAKYQILRIIGAAIASARERAGLAPFDDSIPYSDELPTAFEIIRAGVLP